MLTVLNRNRRSRAPSGICILAGVLLLIACGLPLTDGGGSRGGNPVVTGMIVNPDGTGAPHTQVRLFPQSYDPIKGNALPASFTDTTDESGSFTVQASGPGIYNIQAMYLVNRTRLLEQNIMVEGDTVTIGADTLRKPGTIIVPIVYGFDTVTGYVYIPGTNIAASLQGKSQYVILDSVPSGIPLVVCYATRNSSAAMRIIRDSVFVPQNGSVTISNQQWKFQRNLNFNTSPAGANVSGDVYNFPVLIRLTASHFNFGQAARNGEDIRFTKADGSQLQYEIERWDSSNGRAEIWVKIDTVFGNNNSQHIVMYWGAPAAQSLSNGPAVFDTVNGFQGVWHLAETGNSITRDATWNRYDGVPSDTAPVGAEGAIGPCRSFNGSSNFIRMNGTADSKLNFPGNGIYTVSAWAYADSIDYGSHLIVGKSNEQYAMKFKFSVWNSPMVWELSAYLDSLNWCSTNSLPLVPSAKTWTHIVGVHNGTAQYFFLNGKLVDSSISVSTGSRPVGQDVTIGRFLSKPPDSVEGICPFFGMIDEVRVSNVACSADWIKLCYMNQKEQDALVKW